MQYAIEQKQKYFLNYCCTQQISSQTCQYA